jgi:hypothetical protein
MHVSGFVLCEYTMQDVEYIQEEVVHFKNKIRKNTLQFSLLL